mgnify:CR=1 FL=1
MQRTFQLPEGLPGPAFWVEPDALASVAGSTLFYPAAGSDMGPMLNAFSPSIQKFVFNDLYSGNMPGSGQGFTGFRRVSGSDGPDCLSGALVEERHNGKDRTYRHLDPSFQYEAYEREGIRIEVIRRRGFGQYALLEQPAGSIGVFVHRSDSCGEAGSNMTFLGNVQRRHEPLSNLWDKLALRLRPQALIVSDGSLTRFNWLQVRELGAEAAYVQRRASSPLLRKGFNWRCVGFMADHGRTLIWQVTKVA